MLMLIIFASGFSGNGGSSEDRVLCRNHRFLLQFVAIFEWIFDWTLERPIWKEAHSTPGIIGKCDMYHFIWIEVFLESFLKFYLILFCQQVTLVGCCDKVFEWTIECKFCSGKRIFERDYRFNESGNCICSFGHYLGSCSYCK